MAARPVAEAFITGAAAARLPAELAQLNNPCAPPTATRHSGRPWTAQSCSAGGVPPTCGPSSALALACPGRRRTPATRLSWTCPPSRSGRPELLITAKAQRWAPEELLRTSRLSWRYGGMEWPGASGFIRA